MASYYGSISYAAFRGGHEIIGPFCFSRKEFWHHFHSVLQVRSTIRDTDLSKVQCLPLPLNTICFIKTDYYDIATTSIQVPLLHEEFALYT